MCHFCSCFGWAIDIIQRMITYVLTCFISTVMFVAILFGLLIGLAYGYNYGMAEYVSLKSSDAEVILLKDVTATKLPSSFFKSLNMPTDKNFDENSLDSKDHIRVYASIVDNSLPGFETATTTKAALTVTGEVDTTVYPDTENTVFLTYDKYDAYEYRPTVPDVVYNVADLTTDGYNTKYRPFTDLRVIDPSRRNAFRFRDAAFVTDLKVHELSTSGSNRDKPRKNTKFRLYPSVVERRDDGRSNFKNSKNERLKAPAATLDDVNYLIPNVHYT